MNVMDRGFLYVGVLSVVSLVGMAIYAIETANFTKLSTLPPPQEVFVGTTDSNQCYVSDTDPELYSSANTIVPDAIKWSAIGSNHSYTITFPSQTPLRAGSIVQVPAGGSSMAQFLSPGKVGDFPYTVQNDKGTCTGSPLPGPAWVHVSK
jgi:hypothetical protein